MNTVYQICTRTWMLELQEWKNSELLIVEDMLLNEQDNVTRVS